MTEKEELEFEMQDDYDLSNPIPNPYSRRAKEAAAMAVTVTLDADVAQTYQTAEAVNEALRLLMKTAEATHPYLNRKAS